MFDLPVCCLCSTSMLMCCALFVEGYVVGLHAKLYDIYVVER